MPTDFDHAIVGAGLAGAALAWQLEALGRRVLLIDDARPVTASRIAAGLVTPITGPRASLNWRIDEFLPLARAFYRRIEAATGAALFHDRTAVRLFATYDERTEWQRRCDDPRIAAFVTADQPRIDPAVADTAAGGFEMAAAQLDVPAWLHLARRHFDAVTAAIDWRRDVVFERDAVMISGRRVASVISCEGHAATRNPYLARVPFASARGDILTLRFARPLPPVVVHRGVWLAPTDDPAVFHAGATFDRTCLEDRPTDAGRAELEARLAEFLRAPFDVVGHRGAVRPILRQSRPVIGRHAREQRLAFFNGLGAKGVLTAPWFAGRLARHLVEGAPLSPDDDLRTFAPEAVA